MSAVVVVLIVRSAFDILRDASLWLTDRVVVDMEEVADITYSVPGVLFVHRIRSRGTPDSAFVDLHVKVSPGMSTSRAHAIASEVERRLIAEIEPVREALVHIEPIKKEQPSLWDRMSEDVRRIAEGFGLGLHDLHIHTGIQLGYVVEVHLEFSDQVTLRQAHDLAEEFENQVKRHWPDIEEVITHLEPVPKKVLELESNASVSVERKIYQVLEKFVPIDQVKSLHLYQTGDHLHANLVLDLPGEMELTQAHEIAEQIELSLRSQPSGVSHVIVHLEPSDNGR